MATNDVLPRHEWTNLRNHYLCVKKVSKQCTRLNIHNHHTVRVDEFLYPSGKVEGHIITLFTGHDKMSWILIYTAMGFTMRVLSWIHQGSHWEGFRLHSVQCPVQCLQLDQSGKLILKLWLWDTPCVTNMCSPQCHSSQRKKTLWSDCVVVLTGSNLSVRWYCIQSVHPGWTVRFVGCD